MFAANAHEREAMPRSTGFRGAADAYWTAATVAPVPLPAGAWLALAGLGALAGVRRARR